MLLDLLIVLFAISALYRGREAGFVRQAGSTIGFFGGLFVGAWLQPHVVTLAHSQNSRALLASGTIIACALLLLAIGEYVGLRIKHLVLLKKINIYDNAFGSVLGVVSVLASVWLLSAAFASIPIPSVQAALRSSRIVTGLNRALPQAPNIIADLGHLINPNGSPDVFLGREPQPKGKINISPTGDLRQAVERDQASVVKVAGVGCGGIVEGSGFVVGPGLVATNAHVIAGVAHPYVQDANGNHSAAAIWFDPNLDFAVLRVHDLAGPSLTFANGTVGPGTQAAVMGYPGGGSFSADSAAVLDEFTARGRDIYNNGATNRDVYELQANVVPGNSGGPLIAADGSVIGVIFAASTSYNQVGYALTSPAVAKEVQQATAHNQAVSTGQCAD